ncbi:MAG TPA: dihydrofolate reductase family protein [Mucilaginibacter sp.]|nr:dihydrofolate reductase family protein [Mucilaginibacter sp.]
MRSIILIVHLSLDGYTAGPKGELTYFSPSAENLDVVNGITANADTALFGRKTYELLNPYWPSRYQDPAASPAEIAYSEWYNAARKIVVSTTLQENERDNIEIIREPSVAKLHALKQQPGKNILLFGSPTLSETLMLNDLIDEFQILMYPAFFGKGLPLFANLTEKVGLKLMQSEVLTKGELMLHYKR